MFICFVKSISNCDTWANNTKPNATIRTIYSWFTCIEIWLVHILSAVSPPKHVPGKAGGGWDDSDDDVSDCVSKDDVMSEKDNSENAKSESVGREQSRYCIQTLTSLVNLLHGLLNCEIGGLDCRVITTEYRTSVHYIHM